MPAPIYGLSESDVALIKELIADRKRNVIRTRSRSVEELLPSTPEVYIALTPLGGISPLTIQSGLVEPGYAQCNIYQLVPVVSAGTHTPYAVKLQQVNIFPQVVYNVSNEVVIGGQYIVVQRDKFGSWVTSGCVACGSIAGTGTGHNSCCKGYTLPQYICLHISNFSNCPALNGLFTLTQTRSGPDNFVWSGPSHCGVGGSDFWQLNCSGNGLWELAYYGGSNLNVQFSIFFTNVVCSPFSASGVGNSGLFSAIKCCPNPAYSSFNWSLIGGLCSGTGTKIGTGTHGGAGGCSGALYTTVGCCPNQCIPSPLHLTVNGSPCTGFNGIFTLSFTGSSWTFTTVCSGVFIKYELACIASIPNNFALNIYENGSIILQSQASIVVCPSPGPLSIQGSFTINPGDTCCPAGGTNNWSVGL